MIMSFVPGPQKDVASETLAASVKYVGAIIHIVTESIGVASAMAARSAGVAGWGCRFGAPVADPAPLGRRVA